MLLDLPHDVGRVPDSCHQNHYPNHFMVNRQINLNLLEYYNAFNSRKHYKILVWGIWYFIIFRVPKQVYFRKNNALRNISYNQWQCCPQLCQKYFSKLKHTSLVITYSNQRNNSCKTWYVDVKCYIQRAILIYSRFCRVIQACFDTFPATSTVSTIAALVAPVKLYPCKKIDEYTCITAQVCYYVCHVVMFCIICWKLKLPFHSNNAEFYDKRFRLFCCLPWNM